MKAAYFHIPYCVSKCAYCDFYSRGGASCVPFEYISAVMREIERHKLESVSTVYFGGGTPSLLSPAQAQQIIAACSPEKGAEVTLEVNPDTVTEPLMNGFYEAGVNRVSLGVQTAHDASLARLGRTHTASTAARALDIIAKAGFKNISGDIMLSLPHYSCAEFDKTLELLKNGGATHISAYILKIEKRTAFGKHLPAGLPTDDETADFYLYAAAQLERAGYMQYEISSFAQKGHESRHNMAYWNCEDYIGIGAAAHSCVNGKRFYYKASEKDFIKSGTIVSDGECTLEDYIMLQLRLNKGLSHSELMRIYKAALSQKQLLFLRRCESEGYAKLTQSSVSLTPKGLLVQNSILSELL